MQRDPEVWYTVNSRMETAVQCSSCLASMPRAFDRTCPKCGWDNQIAIRKCLHCRAMISLNETLTYRSIIGSGLVIGAIAWYFLGPLLGGAIGLAVGALGSLATLVNLRYKCGGCGKRPDGRLRSTTEKHRVLLRRLGYLAATVVLAAGALHLYMKFRGH